MKKYPDFWSVLLGSGPHGFFFGYVVLAYIGAIGMIVILAANRDKTSPNTPEQWSWKFFWADNALRFLAGFFLIPLFVRLIYQEVGMSAMIPMSIGIGFGFQGLAYVARSIGLFTTNALSQRVAGKLNQQNDNQHPQPPQS
ncbi:MAG TPA: hypothetical protein VG870_04195 [Chitinophagaceae bacterium]|nr:hypothetical protein [Chitinophagaceae bacterium]